MATTTPPINALIGWTRKNNRASRVPRFLAQFFDVVCQTTTWSFDFWGCDDNAIRSSKTFMLPWNASVPRQRKTLRLFRTTWLTWSSGKTINLTQSSILMWRFRCSSGHSLLNSQLCLSRKVDNNGYGKIVWECYWSYPRHFYLYISFTDLSMMSTQIVRIKSFKWPDVYDIWPCWHD